MRTDRTGGGRRHGLQEGSGTVGIYGMGLAGLSLAATCVGPAATVRAVGRDRERAERLRRGDLPPGVPDRYDAVVETALAAGVLQPTDDGPATAAEADVHVIAAPVDARSDRVADLRRVRTAVRDVASGLAAGDLVLVESPVPPGTTADLVRPLLVDESDLDADEFGLAYAATPRGRDDGEDGRSVAVVGGVTDADTRSAAAFYETITIGAVHTVESPAVAETAATVRDAYRYVTSALSGELARLAEELGTDVGAAMDAADRLGEGSLPGPAPGPRGHDLPFAPYRLLGQTGTPTPVLSAARETMIDLPEFLARTTVQHLHHAGVPAGTATVAVCGLLPVPDGTVRQVSPAVPITEELDARGATVLGIDPAVEEYDPFEADPAPVGALGDLDLDAAVLLEDRAAFRSVDWDAVSPDLVVDAVGAIDDVDARHYVLGSGVQ